MSTATNNPSQCLQISDLTPKQLESLSFVPGSLNNFDEKDNLPPTARPQWAYVQLHPTEYLERFRSELGLLGIPIAIFFINKDTYRDDNKDLTTPITVNLIVQSGQFAEIRAHLEEKKFSHRVLEGEKGFALPYLGSIQKMLEALSLEKLVSYVFLKNSISREAYFTWISVPKQYLSGTPFNKEASQRQKSQKVWQEVDQKKPEEEKPVNKTALPSKSRKSNSRKENFNYVIYDETGETVPPIPIQPKQQIPNSIVVAKEPAPKQNFIGKLLGKNSGGGGKSHHDTDGNAAPCPIARYDGALFLGLGLFNFYCSIILLTFLSDLIAGLASVMLEAVTVSALAALLFTILVIRPSFRNPAKRLWSLAAYLGYFIVAGYHIFLTLNSSEPGGYLTPTAIALVCLMTALISSFMRIDRMSLKKAKTEAKGENNEHEPSAGTAEPVSTSEQKPEKNDSLEAKKLPPPVRPKAKNGEIKRIELKSSKNQEKPTANEKFQTVAPDPASLEPQSGVMPARSIPVKPITEAQKNAIRSRLSRKDLSTKPPSSNSPEFKSETFLKEEQKPLSTAEIRAKLAARLEETRKSNHSLNSTSLPASGQLPNPAPEETGKPKFQLSKPGVTEQSEAALPQEETEQLSGTTNGTKKLSLPKD